MGLLGSTFSEGSRFAGSLMTSSTGRHRQSGGLQYIGRKHTEESKRRLSDIMKAKYAGKTHPQRGKMWITNGTTSTLIKRDAPIPDGFSRGTLPSQRRGLDATGRKMSVEVRRKISESMRRIHAMLTLHQSCILARLHSC